MASVCVIQPIVKGYLEWTTSISSSFYFSDHKRRRWLTVRLPSTQSYWLWPLLWGRLWGCDLWPTVTWCDLAWPDVTCSDLTWPDLAWRDLWWPAVTWRDLIWRDLTWPSPPAADTRPISASWSVWSSRRLPASPISGSATSAPWCCWTRDRTSTCCSPTHWKRQ